jgi:pimeloyl-ACP methyl ester carboxylesterase
MPASGPSTPILFLHGCWHGSWCRAEVLAQVTGVGAGRWPLAVDMAGHGPRARPAADPGSSAPAAACGRGGPAAFAARITG